MPSRQARILFTITHSTCPSLTSGLLSRRHLPHLLITLFTILACCNCPPLVSSFASLSQSLARKLITESCPRITCTMPQKFSVHYQATRRNHLSNLVSTSFHSFTTYTGESIQPIKASSVCQDNYLSPAVIRSHMDVKGRTR